MESTSRVGLLTRNDNSFRLISPESQENFSTIDELCSQKKWKISFAEPEVKEVESETMIEHLPIKHSAAHDIVLENVISYAKQKGSAVRFAAGYWGLRFSHAWTAAFCPKLQTLEEYDHVGPFASKLELNTVLAQKNRDYNKLKMEREQR